MPLNTENQQVGLVGLRGDRGQDVVTLHYFDVTLMTNLVIGESAQCSPGATHLVGPGGDWEDT
jgi:hypothetical protein